MQPSAKTKVAIKVIIELAMNTSEEMVTAKAIEKRQCVPGNYLRQILAMLKQTGIITSKRGIFGGYMLTKPPSEITLLSVLDITQPALVTEAFQVENKDSSDQQNVLKEIWSKLNLQIRDQLQSITIEDICKHVRSKRGNLVRNYVI
jgi:Rrf2 family protein